MREKFLPTSAYFAIALFSLNVAWVDSGKAGWEIEVSSDRQFSRVLLRSGTNAWPHAETTAPVYSSRTPLLGAKKPLRWWVDKKSGRTVLRGSAKRKNPGEETLGQYEFVSRYMIKDEEDLASPFEVTLLERVYCCYPLLPGEERELVDVVVTPEKGFALPMKYGEEVNWKLETGLGKTKLGIKIKHVK